MSVIEVTCLRVTINGREVVRGVDVEVQAGERVGIVGESGSGKSMTALAIMRLVPRNAQITGGSILHHGQDLASARDDVLDGFRGRTLGMVFQNAAAALNPVLKVGRQVADVLVTRRRGRGASSRGSLRGRRRAAADQVRQLLAGTGLADADAVMQAYPHQLSGGMAQRVLIAMALSSDPELLIADEPTTGLDMSIQAQVIRLLRERLEASGSALLLISHDIAVIGQVCDRIAVMYAGRIVESGSAEAVLGHPKHPYTRALLACATDASVTLRGVMPTIPGEPPDLSEPIVGCSFAPRCPLATELCRREMPPNRVLAGGQRAECHYAE
jgi:oligopeptide/dipeptide ABC transporter ATP-binding protein